MHARGSNGGNVGGGGSASMNYNQSMQSPYMNYDNYYAYNQQYLPVDQNCYGSAAAAQNDLFDDLDLQDWMEPSPSKDAAGATAATTAATAAHATGGSVQTSAGMDGTQSEVEAAG